VGKAFEEVTASFERFCLAAGIEALSAMMERDAEETCGAKDDIGDIIAVDQWTVLLRGPSESPRQNSCITVLFAPVNVIDRRRHLMRPIRRRDRGRGQLTFLGLSCASALEILRHVAECLEDHGFFELAKAWAFDMRQRHCSGVRPVTGHRVRVPDHG
jgi:hypothetical protein